MLLCSTSEDFGISSVGVRWQLLLEMGSKCGNDCMSSGDSDMSVCVRARALANGDFLFIYCNPFSNCHRPFVQLPAFQTLPNLRECG